MKKVGLLMMLVLLVMSFTTIANPVDFSTAQSIGAKFLSANTRIQLRGANDLQLVKTYSIDRGDAAFYVFNAQNGFVIVAADDCATPILGYSDEGRPFDPNDVPVQLEEYLQGFVEQIQYGVENNVKDETTAQQWEQVRATGRLNDNRDGDVVGPLLTMHWKQGWPYNALCPIDNIGARSLVGCLPVAIGQIMKYHNWPPKGFGYVHYTLNNFSDAITAVFDTTYYDWANMPDVLTDSDYEATAQLLADIGKSAFAHYGSGGTSAGEDDMKSSLADVFNYDYFSMQYIFRYGADDNTWFALIKNELDNNRPVYYGGWNSEPPAIAGHGWVCDGYDANNMCHFNLGWGGQCDGYYSLSYIVDPFFFNYNYQQRILIGIQPSTGSILAGTETLSGSLTYDESLYCGAFSNITIMPGTEMKFAPGKAACFAGSVLANGTEDNPITITAVDTTLGWGGMQIHPSMMCYKMLMEPDTLRFNHTTISYSTDDGINFGWPNYTIYPVTVENVVHDGLFLDHVKIQHNIGIGIGGRGKGREVDCAIITLDSCEISNNGKYGIDLSQGYCNMSNSLIHHNKSAIRFQNQVGLEICDSISSMINCKIYNNDYEIGDNARIIDFEGVVSGCEIFNNAPVDGEIQFRQVIKGGSFYENDIHDNVCNIVVFLSGNMYNNIIHNNIGEIISCYGVDRRLEIINNVIFNNTGRIDVSDNQLFISNNTIVNNSQGVFIGQTSDCSLVNNIIWNNVENEVNVDDSFITFKHNLVKGGSSSIIANNPNNIIVHTCDKDPKFVNPTTFVGNGEIPEDVDFSLTIASPAIDNAFYDTTMFLPDFDLNGNPRINRILDIGAYENQSDTVYPCFLTEGYNVKSCNGLSVDLSMPYRGELCSFEWYHNGDMIPESNHDTLYINPVTGNDAGDYYCVISNSIGVDTSGVIHLGLSPQLPDCIEAIYGTDTIHHFQKDVPFSINNVANADLIEWVVSDGLSYTKTSDTSVLVSVHEAVDNAFLYVVASNGCGACADTARIDFTVLPTPETIKINGPDFLIADYEYGWPMPEMTVDAAYYYDAVEWQTPSWISVYQEQSLLYFISTQANSCSTDTIYARWYIDGYGYGEWTPYPIKVFHQEDYGDIIYVSTVNGGADNGSTWADATNLRTALSLASYLNKEIWVASGVYYGDGSSDNAFAITDRIHVYGGFAGNESADYDLSQRDFTAHQTIFDGQHLQCTLYHGWYWFQDVESRPLIDGAVIQNGYGCNVYDNSENGIALRNCIIRNGNGGVSNAFLQNCIVYNNHGSGGAINKSTAENCVLCNNDATTSVGFYSTFTNCILWDNEGYDQGWTNTFTYSAIEGWTGGGEGNISLAGENDGYDPNANYVRFVDPENGDFRLGCGSACINMGTPDVSGLDLPSFDLQGNPRVMDGRIDMGAYEFDPETECPETITQTTPVTIGWNWYSTYIELGDIDGLAMLEAQLGGNAESIASQTSFTMYYGNYGWYGSLTSINNESMYRIKMSSPTTINMMGMPVNPADHPITVTKGWNHIGYLSSEPMAVDDALAGMESEPGDIVKNLSTYAQYYDGYGWYGSLSLSAISPGQGLMYKSVANESKTFTYPTNPIRSSLANYALYDLHWMGNPQAYPANMTMMAVVELGGEEVKSEDYELAVFAKGECRGSVRLQYVEPIDRYVAFLTISGDEDDYLYFGLYNRTSGSVNLTSENRIVYHTDDMIGGFETPYVVRFSDAEGGDIKVYPNPVKAGESLNIVVNESATVEIVNALGEVVAVEKLTGNSALRTPATAGVYMLRIITADNNVTLRRVVIE